MKSIFDKKRLVSLILVFVLSVMLSACAGSGKGVSLKQTDKSKYVLGKMDGIMTVDEILSDISQVDLFHEMKTDGLECKKSVDDKNSTVDYLYYDKDGSLVYTDREGYGEDSFDYCTKSKSGIPITVTYVEQEGKRYSVSVACEKYVVDFKDIDKSEKHGAKELFVTGGNTDKGTLSNTVTYVIEGDKCRIDSAYYFDKDGFHRYSCSKDGEKLDEYDDVIFEKADSIDTNSNVLALSKNEAVSDTEILLGNHKIKYTESGSGEKNWFIVADLFFVIDSDENAEAFEKASGYKAEPSSYAEGLLTVTVPQAVIPVSSSFDGFYEFVNSDFSDYTFESITLSENGELLEFGTDAPLLMYY